MTARALLKKYFSENDAAFEIVYQHSRKVADKALAIARTAGLEKDLVFIEEAALLHDIGVCRVHAPKLNCFGSSPYICHGIIGREILEREGLPEHALVCERHIGVGLTAADVTGQKLPLPAREMSPATVSERIIAMADLFFSKKHGELDREKSVDQVRGELLKFGPHKVAIFDSWLNDFAC
ncbi:MAG TPA: HD domain-containing protein [Geomonas sp.]|nr:HD domain-containing protein [Geomonas sp.]